MLDQLSNAANRAPPDLDLYLSASFPLYTQRGRAYMAAVRGKTYLAKNRTAALTVANQGSNTIAPERAGNTQDMDRLKYAGLTATIPAMEHIHLAQPLQVHLAKVAYIVYLDLF